MSKIVKFSSYMGSMALGYHFFPAKNFDWFWFVVLVTTLALAYLTGALENKTKRG